MPFSRIGSTSRVTGRARAMANAIMAKACRINGSRQNRARRVFGRPANKEELADGKADEREAGLLVRIYSRVNDSVAASEILEEYMTQSGRNEVERLQEKGRIYQVCNDYWNYEKVI